MNSYYFYRLCIAFCRFRTGFCPVLTWKMQGKRGKTGERACRIARSREAVSGHSAP